MDPFTLSLILGGALGVGRGVQGMAQESRDRDLRSAEQRYSPWTHQAATTQIKKGDLFGNALQGGLAGAQFGMGLENHQKDMASPYPAPRISVVGPAAMQAGLGPAGPVAYNPWSTYAN